MQRFSRAWPKRGGFWGKRLWRLVFYQAFQTRGSSYQAVRRQLRAFFLRLTFDRQSSRLVASCRYLFRFFMLSAFPLSVGSVAGRTTFNGFLTDEGVSGVEKCLKTNYHLLTGWDATFSIEKLIYSSISGEAGARLLHAAAMEAGRVSACILFPTL